MITGSWVRERARPMPACCRDACVRCTTLVLVLVLALCVWLGWLWYRSSSFVKVEHVTVAGLSGPDIPRSATP